MASVPSKEVNHKGMQARATGMDKEFAALCTIQVEGQGFWALRENRSTRQKET